MSFKTKIVPRDYTDKQGKCLLYLHVTGESKRKRIPLDIYITPRQFSKKKQRLTSKDQFSKDINLVLDNIDSKITAIRTTYRLTNQSLDTETFIEEFVNGIPRIDFVAYCTYSLKLQKAKLAPGTYRRYESFLKKLRKFKTPLLFTEMHEKNLLKIRKWLKQKGNQNTTIETNMAAIKKFLNEAHNAGILLPLDPKMIKVGRSEGQRVDLTQDEVKKLYSYYTSDFINESNSLILGYFLFSCFSGLRISEVQLLKREQLENDFFVFYEKKNDRLQRRNINVTVRKIIDHNEMLFVTKYTNEHINRALKIIVRTCGITKKISFHNSRHTFATNFLRMGGDIVSLQQLLGHSKIDMTMIYSHIVNAEVNEKVFIIDSLLDTR